MTDPQQRQLARQMDAVFDIEPDDAAEADGRQERIDALHEQKKRADRYKPPGDGTGS